MIESAHPRPDQTFFPSSRGPAAGLKNRKRRFFPNMPRHQTPLAKAKATGAVKNHPERFKDRKAPPDSRPLGEPSRILKKKLELEMWEAFKREHGYLTECDRPIVEQVCKLRAESYRRDLEPKELDQYLRFLIRLGMTPVDRARILVNRPDDNKDDAEDYLN